MAERGWYNDSERYDKTGRGKATSLWRRFKARFTE